MNGVRIRKRAIESNKKAFGFSGYLHHRLIRSLEDDASFDDDADYYYYYYY